MKLLRLLPLLFGLTLRTWGHKSSDAYVDVTLTSKVLSVRFDIAIRDLQEVLDLDTSGDGQISWGELRARESELIGYVASRFAIESDGTPLPLNHWELAVARHGDGVCAALTAGARLPQPVGELSFKYGVLFDLDAQHRGLASFSQSEGSAAVMRTSSSVFSPANRSFVWILARAPSNSFVRFVSEGVHHIWTGYDHMMFLFALLLPAVLLRQPSGAWHAVDRLPRALVEVLRVVTAFTAAHSITLFLAALGWIALPSRLVESLIAASVIVAALGNILVSSRKSDGQTLGSWQVVVRRLGTPPVMAFGFGLIHGFGFASVLGELALDRTSLGFGVLGFNLGVEVGQLVVVAAFIPVAFLLRKTKFYRRIVLQGGSLAIVAVAGAWLVERALGLSFMPF